MERPLPGADGSSSSKERLAVGALAMSGLLWGTSWIPLREFARRGLTGLTVTLLSYGAVSLVALPVVWRERPSWTSQKGLFLSAAVAGGAANLCFVSGLMLGEVVRVMLLFYLTPIWAVLGGRVFLGETMTSARAVSVVVAVGGAFLVLGGSALFTRSFSPADMLGLASGVFYAIQNVAFRAADRVGVLSKALSVFIACSALSAALLAFRGEGLPFVAPTLLSALVGFAAVWIGGAMWTTMYGVTHLEAGRAAVLLVFELVVAVVSAMLLGHERLSGLEWLGAAMIASAALVEARSGPST
jgi:drug/metabolite transporter (DMT)-like permease